MKITRALVPDSERIKIREDLVRKWKEKVPEIRAMAPTMEQFEAVVDKQLSDSLCDTVYLAEADDGTAYQIAVRAITSDVVHLSIKRKDREPCRDWRHLQEIKNELVGEECEGVELYPAESRVVDTANQTHLWIYSDPDEMIPLGWDCGEHKSDIEIADSRQRSRNP